MRAAICRNLTGHRRLRNAAKGGAQWLRGRKTNKDMRVEKHKTRETHKIESEIGEN